MQHSKFSLYYLHIKQSAIYNYTLLFFSVFPELDFRAALNPSTVTIDVVVAGR